MITKNIRLLQVYMFLTGSVFILPVLVLYYRDVIGLGFREFMIGEAGFATVVILMEVPTGWLSDVWKRTHSLILASLTRAGGFLLLWQADSFAEAFTAQCLLGVSISLMSGTNSALLYDNLLAEKREEEYRKRQGFQHGLTLYAVAGASVLGGFLYQANPQIPMLLTILVSLMALVTSLFMTEPDRQKERMHKHPLADMLVTIRYALHGHAEIAGIILLSSIMFTSTKLIMWAQQPYYLALNIPESWFGILLAGGFVVGGLGGHFGHHLDKHFSSRTILSTLISLIFLIFLMSGLIPGYHIIPLLLLGSFVFGFGKPHVENYINKRVSSARRSTIISTASLMVSLMFIPCSLLMSWVSDHAGIYTALLAQAGILGTVGGTGAMIILLRHNKSSARVNLPK